MPCALGRVMGEIGDSSDGGSVGTEGMGMPVMGDDADGDFGDDDDDEDDVAADGRGRRRPRGEGHPPGMTATGPVLITIKPIGLTATRWALTDWVMAQENCDPC